MKLNKPIGTRVVFDDEGNAQAPLAALAVKDDALCELDTQMASKGMLSSTYHTNHFLIVCYVISYVCGMK